MCVVTDEGNGLFEIKNLATDARYQGLGYGSLMVRHVCAQYMGKGTDMLVGTGESPRTLNFYRRCGFSYSHRLKDFFINNYRHPIVEDGVVLNDMIYLKKELDPRCQAGFATACSILWVVRLSPRIRASVS